MLVTLGLSWVGYMKTVISALLLATLALAPCTTFGDVERAVFDQAVEAAKAGDYETAINLFPIIAEQGHASAQFNLGIMYDNGHVILEDSIQAYAWLNIAAANGDNKANDLKSTLNLTRASIKKAQALFRKMVEETPKLLGD